MSQPIYHPATHPITPRPTYAVTRKHTPPPSLNPYAPYWSDVPPLHINSAYFQSSRHHPPTWAKLTHTNTAIHVLFHVADRFLRCRFIDLHSSVYKDSCVEFFLRPHSDRPFDNGGGYFNVEINCVGTLFASYIENPRKIRNKIQKFTLLPPTEARQIPITSSIQLTPPFDHSEPLDWSLQYSIPINILENHLGPLAPLAGQTWHANFFKCADRSKYPHWLSWAPIGRHPNFHQPDRFGAIYFKTL
ncbi:MAG: carbohydrate-binding family 9-like protein [Phycisphaerales bacterium]|nr:carbohydrate-binding family 9-like protein [Phycisphaerales bacterium]